MFRNRRIYRRKITAIALNESLKTIETTIQMVANAIKDMEYASLSSADMGSGFALWCRHKDAFESCSKRLSNLLDILNRGAPLAPDSQCRWILDGYYSSMVTGMNSALHTMLTISNPKEIIKNPDGYHILNQHIDALNLLRAIEKEIKLCQKRAKPIENFINPE